MILLLAGLPKRIGSLGVVEAKVLGCVFCIQIGN